MQPPPRAADHLCSLPVQRHRAAGAGFPAELIQPGTVTQSGAAHDQPDTSPGSENKHGKYKV